MNQSAEAVSYKGKRSSVDWLAIWILLSAWASFSGWVLAMSGLLYPGAIIGSFCLFAGGLWLMRSHLRAADAGLYRFRFWAPRLWLLLTVLALAGGLAYAPNNFDYLSYRFPRILNWTWDHSWSWITTVNQRMNLSGTGFEWLMVPLYSVFRTDRLFFLINFLPYLLLPGLVFSVFSQLGISKRISWWWMWVLPCGYCYLLQASSVGNDSYAAVYFLAALHYLFRMRTAPSPRNLPLSIFAIALTTGVKATTVPLVLPWGVLLFFQRKYLFRDAKPVVLAASVIVAAVVSFLPIAALNIHYTGDFAGDPHNDSQYKITHPIAGIEGNVLQLVVGNLAPPVMPRQIDWQVFLPTSFRADLLRDYPHFDLSTGELHMEEETGAGLGCVLFGGLFLVARLVFPGHVTTRSNLALWMIAAGAIAGLAYLAKMGVPPTSRLMACYYPIFIAGILVLVSLDGKVIRHAVFNWIGFIAMLSALPLVILCPARPLFPVQAVSSLMTSAHFTPEAVSRIDRVYSAYATRANPFRELTAQISPDELALGVIQLGDNPEASLWQPFGVRKVIMVTPGDSTEQVKAAGVHFVIVGQDALTYRYHTTIADLVAKWSATLVSEKQITLKAHRGPENWYLLTL